MKKTAIEIIDETVAYYSEDIKRRAKIFNPDGYGTICQYYTKDGQMCAVGRCLEEPEKFKGDGSSANQLNAEWELDTILKEEYRDQPISFWDKLQSLHDNDVHWDKEGLSKKGKSFVNVLKKKYT